MPILKLKQHDEEKELNFEVEFQLSKSFEERYKMMIEASDFLIKMLDQNEKRKPFQIIKRK